MLSMILFIGKGVDSFTWDEAQKNVDDLRESPSIEILNLLSKRCKHSICGSICKNTRNKEGIIRLKSMNLSEEVLKSFDVVLLLTDA